MKYKNSITVGSMYLSPAFVLLLYIYYILYIINPQIQYYNFCLIQSYVVMKLRGKKGYFHLNHWVLYFNYYYFHIQYCQMEIWLIFISSYFCFMFSIFFIKALKIFIKFILHSYSSQFINSASSGIRCSVWGLSFVTLVFLRCVIFFFWI